MHVTHLHAALCLVVKTYLVHVLPQSTSPNTFTLQLAESEISNCGYACVCFFSTSWPDSCLEDRNMTTSQNLKQIDVMSIPMIRVSLLGSRLCLLERHRVTSDSHIIDRGTVGTAFQHRSFYLTLFCNSRQSGTRRGIRSHGRVDKSSRRPSRPDQ
jgi:hypothetical protein